MHKTKTFFIIDKNYLDKLMNYLIYIQNTGFRQVDGIEIDEITPDYLKPVVITNNLNDVEKFLNQNKTVILIKKERKNKVIDFLIKLRNSILPTISNVANKLWVKIVRYINFQ